jgi:hypothetical protein
VARYREIAGQVDSYLDIAGKVGRYRDTADQMNRYRAQQIRWTGTGTQKVR